MRFRFELRLSWKWPVTSSLLKYYSFKDFQPTFVELVSSYVLLLMIWFYELDLLVVNIRKTWDKFSENRSNIV